MIECTECTNGVFVEINEVFHPEVGMVIESEVARSCPFCNGTGIDFDATAAMEDEYFGED